MPLPSVKARSNKAEINEIVDVLGPRIQFLTALSDNDDDYCLKKQFADALGIPANTVRSWEQCRKRPSGAARTLLRLIEQKPELLEVLQTAAT